MVHFGTKILLKKTDLYSCEVWQPEIRTEQTLGAVEIDFWRRAAGTSRLERVINELIRQIMEVLLLL